MSLRSLRRTSPARLAVAASLSAAVLGAVVARATDDPKKPAKPPATKPAATTKPAKVQQDYWTAPMDYGPFLMTSVSRPAAKPYKTTTYAGTDAPKFPVDSMSELVAGKGLVIPLGPKDAKGNPAVTVCYDLDTMALAAAWTGGWLDLSGTMQTNHKGTSQVTIAGTELFSTKGLGWGGGESGVSFADPRPGAVGPLPEDRIRFDGVAIVGRAVVLRYRVNGTPIVEVPGVEVGPDGVPVVTRTIRIEKGDQPLAIELAKQWPDDSDHVAIGNFAIDAAPGIGAGIGVSMQGKAWTMAAYAVGDGLTVTEPGNGVTLGAFASARRGPVVAKILLRSGRDDTGAAMKQAVRASDKPVDPATVMAPKGTATSVITAGKLAAAAKPGKKTADPAFVVDEITLPFQNPANSWMRLAGLDFFADGRAAVSTINGDVWIASGIDDTLEKITWTRFASGLYHPMGLKVVGDDVYVRSRDFLLRLKDTNADGVADLYENVSGEGATHPSYHGFVFDLQTDTAGNFYYARGGIGMDPSLAGHGQLTQVSKDGKAVRTIASGLRAPNGLGMVGNGWVTVSDNQGNWIPSSKIHLIDPAKGGGFLGFLPHHHEKTIPTDAARPLVWIPHKLDNSSGGQCEVPAGAWGPFAGQWIHTSFGAACVTLLLPDANTPAGEMPAQAAVVRLPLEFATGIMRPRFSPKDGQLYVAGVGGGWQTKGTADGGLYRVRFTGKPSLAPTKFALVPGGVKLTFAQPLDKTEATDVQNYAVEQWNYKWSEKYGSPDFSAKNPAKAGHDEIEVKAAELSADGLTVTLKLAEVMVVDQLRIQCNLKTATGQELEQEIFATVNKLPK
jgi:hypothetical protein